MKRVTLLISAMMLGILVSSGIALAVAKSGTDGKDIIEGTNKVDALSGRGGNDTISGLNGNDSISGGPGNDKLWGGEPYPFVSKSGDDSISGGNGRDLVVGGFGADRLSGGAGNDSVVEGPDEDQSKDIMSGGSGDDLMSAAGTPASKDIISCGPGNDTVQADEIDVVAKDCENVEIFGANEETEPTFTAQSTLFFDCIVPRFGNDICGGITRVNNGDRYAVTLQFSGGKTVNFQPWASVFGPDYDVGRRVSLRPGGASRIAWRNGGPSADVYSRADSPAIVKVRAQGFYTSR